MEYACGAYDPKVCVWPAPARGGTIRLVLGAVVFSIVVFVVARSVPFLIADFHLGMQLDDLVAHDSSTGAANDLIRADVVRCAENLGLPVTPDNVEVSGDGRFVSVKVNYRVEVDLKVYTWPIYFSHLSTLHPV